MLIKIDKNKKRELICRTIDLNQLTSDVFVNYSVDNRLQIVELIKLI